MAVPIPIPKSRQWKSVEEPAGEIGLSANSAGSLVRVHARSSGTPTIPRSERSAGCRTASRLESGPDF
jgi:hypothetical protein